MGLQNDQTHGKKRTMVGLCGNNRSSQGFKSASEAGFICISAGTIQAQQAARWSISRVGVRQSMAVAFEEAANVHVTCCTYCLLARLHAEQQAGSAQSLTHSCCQLASTTSVNSRAFFQL